PLRHAVLKDEVLSLHIANLMQCLPEYLYIASVTVKRTEQEKTDLGDFSRLLRVRGKRHHEETESEDDQASYHAAPHDHLLPLVPCMTCSGISVFDSRTLAVSRAQ